MCGYGSRRVSDVYRTCSNFFTQSFMVLANQSSYSSAEHEGLLHPRMVVDNFDICYFIEYERERTLLEGAIHDFNYKLISSQEMVLG